MLLYIMLAYLMLLAALSNAVCLHNASFLPLIFANAFSWFIDTYFVYFMYYLASCSAFNVLVFPNSMFTPFFCFSMTGLCALWRNST